MQKGNTPLAEIEFLHGQPTPHKTNKHKRKKARPNAKNPVLNKHDKTPSNIGYLISLIIVGLLMSFDVYGHEIGWTETGWILVSAFAFILGTIALILAVVYLGKRGP